MGGGVAYPNVFMCNMRLVPYFLWLIFQTNVASRSTVALKSSGLLNLVFNVTFWCRLNRRFGDTYQLHFRGVCVCVCVVKVLLNCCYIPNPMTYDNETWYVYLNK